MRSAITAGQYARRITGLPRRTSMSEVEQVAKAMRDADPLGRGYRGDVSAYFPQARVAIAALDSHRAAEKRKNCKHHNTTGTGMVGSDGSSYYDWYCKDCYASGRSETPARPATALTFPQNGVVGSPGHD
jgi:hypothetical protein